MSPATSAIGIRVRGARADLVSKSAETVSKGISSRLRLAMSLSYSAAISPAISSRRQAPISSRLTAAQVSSKGRAAPHIGFPVEIAVIGLVDPGHLLARLAHQCREVLTIR